MLILSGVILAVIVAAGMLWSHLRNRFPESAFTEWLATQIPGRVVFNDVKRTAVRQSDGSHLVKFEAQGSVPATLYVQENTSAYLRRLGLSPAPAAALRDATEAANDPRVRERIGSVDTALSAFGAIILRETSAGGQAFPLSGVATAQKVDGEWRFTLLQGTFTRAIPEGKPREEFGAATFVAGNADDDAALRAAIEKQNEIISRLVLARAEILAEAKQAQEARLARLQELIAAGSFFVSAAAAADKNASFSIEITQARSGSRQVSALIRNAGGWSDARPFSGTWKLDETSGVFSLNLVSRSNQAIADAGPLLSVGEAISLWLQLSEDGLLRGTGDHVDALKLTRVSADQAKAQLAARWQTAMDATRADTLYLGTATTKSTGHEENVVLRFTRQSADGASLTASFEATAPGVSLRRPLRGAIIDNTFRAGDLPIRLQMPGSGRARSAPANTLFSHAVDTAPAFRVDGDKLIGEDEIFSYVFERTTAAAVAALKEQTAAPRSEATVEWPRSNGLYGRNDDNTWAPLPRNGGSSSAGLGGLARGILNRGRETEQAPLTFKGRTPPPVFEGGNLTLVFKGKLPARPKQAPEDYPLIEVAPTTTQDDGSRSAPLERITSGFAGFGDTRLPVVISQPAADVLTLTFVAPLESGTYAVLIGTDGYEFTVK